LEKAKGFIGTEIEVSVRLVTVGYQVSLTHLSWIGLRRGLESARPFGVSPVSVRLGLMACFFCAFIVL